jgi:hypothetical protein
MLDFLDSSGEKHFAKISGVPDFLSLPNIENFLTLPDSEVRPGLAQKRGGHLFRPTL